MLSRHGTSGNVDKPSVKGQFSESTNSHKVYRQKDLHAGGSKQKGLMLSRLRIGKMSEKRT